MKALWFDWAPNKELDEIVREYENTTHTTLAQADSDRSHARTVVHGGAVNREFKKRRNLYLKRSAAGIAGFVAGIAIFATSQVYINTDSTRAFDESERNIERYTILIDKERTKKQSILNLKEIDSTYLSQSPQEAVAKIDSTISHYQDLKAKNQTIKRQNNISVGMFGRGLGNLFGATLSIYSLLLLSVVGTTYTNIVNKRTIRNEALSRLTDAYDKKRREIQYK